MTEADFPLVQDAYHCMLKVPLGSALRLSIEFQRTLASLRDIVARESLIDPEVIQDLFEARA